MEAPFDMTYVAPLGPVPYWLSYQLSPTATLVLPFTVETLAANGDPTAVIGQATVTRYETQLLQLPVTVSLAAVASGQAQISLGAGFTTAGGTEPTIARIYGGTELVTLTPAAMAPSVSAAVSAQKPNSRTVQPQAASARSSAATATLASLSLAQASVASALTTASLASQTFDVSRLSSNLASISSAANAASSRIESAASSTTPSPSLRSDLSISPASPSSTSQGSLSPNRLESLTPSQLAAAIAAPISFFFLVLFLCLLLCCCIRRRRRRKREDNMFEGGLAGGGGSWGNRRTGGGGGGAFGGTTREPSEEWDWIEPRNESRGPGSRLGGFFARTDTGGSRSSTPFMREAGRGGPAGDGEGGGGGVSLLAGGGRMAHESPSHAHAQDQYGDEDEDDDDADDEGGEIGMSAMMGQNGGRRNRKPPALGLGIAPSAQRGGGSPTLPERAAATINAGLRRISGGRLGSSPESEEYAYEIVQASTRDLDLPPPIHSHTMEHPPSRAYWDPYKPSPTTPQFPILAPVTSATSSDEPPRPHDAEYNSGNSTSPDREDVRRANLGLADLTKDSRWSEGGSPRTDGTNAYDDDDDEEVEEAESTEMLASSREESGGDGTRRPRMLAEGNWFSGRPPPVLLPRLIRPPSDVSVSQYSQSDAGPNQRRSDQGMWLARPEFDDRNRSRENSGGSVASDLSMGNDKLSVNELFFSAPRWTGHRHPNNFPTSTISPIVPSGTVGPAGNLTPPQSASSSSSSESLSRYADAPVSQPISSTTRASFHTPRIGVSRSPSVPSRESYEESPMVYPSSRTHRRARTKSEKSRPDSEDVLERVAKSYERERRGGEEGRGNEISVAKRRKRIEDQWKEIRLVDEEPLPPTQVGNDRPFSNLTPLSSPLLPSSPTPPLTVSRYSNSSSVRDRLVHQHQ